MLLCHKSLGPHAGRTEGGKPGIYTPLAVMGSGLAGFARARNG